MSDVRIYYEDSVYTGSPEDIPSPVGVVAVVTQCGRAIKHNVGRFILMHYEYYICLDGDWFGLFTVTDLIDHVLYTKPDFILKGRWVPDKVMDRISHDAHTFELDGWSDKVGSVRVREQTHYRKQDLQ
jgi:hypothetical protein